MRPNTDEPCAGGPSLPSGAITAFRLLGDYDFQNETSRPGILHSSQILASLLTSESQAAHIREVLSAPDTYGGGSALCFIPRLGFTVGSGTEAVDVLICIECDRAYFFRGGARTDEELSDAGRQRFTALQPSRPPDWAPWAVVAGFVGHFIITLTRVRRSSFVVLTCIQILFLAVAVTYYVRQSHLPSGG